jgi:hypothetical protein
MKFTLSKLFLAVTMAALAFAGMKWRTRWWADGIMTSTVLLYALVAVRAINLKGSERAFAIAFAIFGSGYLLLVMSSVFSNIAHLLATNRIICEVAKAVDVPKVLLNEYAKSPGVLPNGSQALEWDDVTLAYANHNSAGGVFLVVGHCIWSWLFALLGGWFASAMYAKREKPKKN